MTQKALEILDILKNADKPLTVSEILQTISVNKTTIYRNLNKLIAQGKVKEVFLEPEVIHYELGNLEHHHHLVCKHCGEIKEINSAKIEKTIQDIEKEVKTSFLIKSHNLEFYGICVNCL